MDRLVRSPAAMATKCNDQCASMESFQPPSSPVFKSEVVVGTVEPRDRRKVMPMISVATQKADSVHKGAIEFPLSGDTRLLGIHWSHFEDHSLLVVALSNLVLVWRIPKAHDGDLELLLAEGSKVRTKWVVCQHHQLHQRDRTGTISTRNLLDPHINNSDVFLDGIVRLSEIFKDADDTFKRSIIRYVERHINQCLDAEDDSAAILTRLCSSWSPECHEHLLAFVHALFGSASFRWIPTAGMSRETNPISILLDHLKVSVMVADVVEIMISYCVLQAKAHSDLRFLDPVFLSLRAAVKSKYITHVRL